MKYLLLVLVSRRLKNYNCARLSFVNIYCILLTKVFVHFILYIWLYYVCMYVSMYKCLIYNYFVQKCDHKIIEDRLIFLYKIVSGISQCFAIRTAAAAGLPKSIVKRSEEIHRCYTQGLEWEPIIISDDSDSDGEDNKMSSA